MSKSKVKVGLVGVVHPNMPGDDRGVYRNVIESMENMKEELDFDLVITPKPLESEEDGRNAKEFLEEQKVDFTLIFNASLGFGRVLLPLARINSFIGLWSVPEPTKDGVLQLNSFCGLNMYAAIIANYLNEYEIPFKWFYGYPDGKLFLERLKITLKAIKAIKMVREARIGLIGGIANGFENFNFDERKLEKKFGTYIQTRHSVEEIVERAKSYDEQKVNKLLNQINSEGSWVKERVTSEEMEKSARVNLALEEFARENNYNVLCISCWPRFQEVYGIAVCASMSRLNESGIVASCEGDVPGALSMLIMNAINGKKSILNDLVSLDEDDNSINMWHCGVASASWANQDGVKWDAHFNIGNYCEGKWRGKGVIADLTFKPGKITIARVNSRFDNLLVMTGEVVKDKKAYFGSSGWTNNLEMNGKKLSIPDLINTIIVNRMAHHYPNAYGDLTNELYEFANWMRLDLINSVPYKPYMQNPEW